MRQEKTFSIRVEDVKDERYISKNYLSSKNCDNSFSYSKLFPQFLSFCIFKLTRLNYLKIS